MIHRLALASIVLLACDAPAAPPRDHERARDANRRGEFVALEKILADAQARQPGRLLDVELDDDEYEIEILRADGVVVEIEYDARSGRLLEIEIEDEDGD
jgi:uncharacterized membrane protein YkoI